MYRNFAGGILPPALGQLTGINSRASTLRFTFGPQGVVTVACSNLTVGSGAKLVVNANA